MNKISMSQTCLYNISYKKKTFLFYNDQSLQRTSNYEAFSCDIITNENKTENSHHVGVRQDRSFYGNLHEMSDMLAILLICVESDKIPLLHKLKQLYKRLPVGFLIDIAYTANNILYKLYTKMVVYF